MPRKKPAGLPPGEPAPAAPGSVYRLKVSLDDIRPMIWRRIEVPDYTLEALHAVIQVVMPWDSSHLWCFEVGRTRYLDPEFIDFDDDRSASETRLGELVASGVKKLKYTYDFGDTWEHTVAVEKVAPPEPDVRYPRCTAGARNCPPDDCGGFPGYERLLYVLAHPGHEEHADMVEWVGGSFDPEAFDPDAINRELRKLKVR